MGTLSYRIVDVFADSIYGGNPLAVVFDGSDSSVSDLTSADMQKIAKEFNLSDTVFILPPSDSANDYRLRIFSTEGELPFAGHPTIGAAFVLADRGEFPKKSLLLEEPFGVIPVDIEYKSGRPVAATLTSLGSPQLFNDPIPRRIAAGLLTLDESQVHGDAWIVSCGLAFSLVELCDVGALASASFNYSYWLRKGKENRLGSLYCYTGEAAPGGELRARFFSPQLGTKEDPATGSAAVALAGLLAIRSGSEGVSRWRIHQGIEIERPSVIDIEAELSGGEVAYAKVGGCVKLVAEGTIKVPPSRNHLVDKSA